MKRVFQTLAITVLAGMLVLGGGIVLAGCSSATSGTNNNTVPSKKSLTAYSFPLLAATGVISGNAISVDVPYGTDVTALVAAFTTNGASVKVGATTQVSGTTANDFTSPVTYTVTAADQSHQDYTVRVQVPTLISAAPQAAKDAFGAATGITDEDDYSGYITDAVLASDQGASLSGVTFDPSTVSDTGNYERTITFDHYQQSVPTDNPVFVNEVSGSFTLKKTTVSSVATYQISGSFAVSGTNTGTLKTTDFTINNQSGSSGTFTIDGVRYWYDGS